MALLHAWTIYSLNFNKICVIEVDHKLDSHNYVLFARLIFPSRIILFVL